MAVSVNNDVVGLEIPEDDVSLVKGLDRKQNLTEVLAGALLAEASLSLKGTTEVTAGAEV